MTVSVDGWGAQGTQVGIECLGSDPRDRFSVGCRDRRREQRHSRDVSHSEMPASISPHTGSPRLRRKLRRAEGFGLAHGLIRAMKEG